MEKAAAEFKVPATRLMAIGLGAPRIALAFLRAALRSSTPGDSFGVKRQLLILNRPRSVTGGGDHQPEAG
jgi:hypothetical protein